MEHTRFIIVLFPGPAGQGWDNGGGREPTAKSRLLYKSGSPHYTYKKSGGVIVLDYTANTLTYIDVCLMQARGPNADSSLMLSYIYIYVN